MSIHKQSKVGKIVLIVILVLVLLVILVSLAGRGSGSGASSGTASSGSSTATAGTAAASASQGYGLGQTWTVDGQWALTVDSVTATDERNQFDNSNPAQVIIVTYSYENLGYTSKIQDLYISSMDMKVIDSGQSVASTYPSSLSNMPQTVPVGARCDGAQASFGLNNASSDITLTFSIYDSHSKKQEATFNLPVQ